MTFCYLHLIIAIGVSNEENAYNASTRRQNHFNIHSKIVDFHFFYDLSFVFFRLQQESGVADNRNRSYNRAGGVLSV
jgi:hypothetical protein